MLIKTEGVLNKRGPPSLLLNLVILLFYCENLTVGKDKTHLGHNQPDSNCSVFKSTSVSYNHDSLE